MAEGNANGVVIVQPKVAQQRAPHAVNEVLVVQRFTQPVSKHVGGEFITRRALGFQRVIDHLVHLDVAHGPNHLEFVFLVEDDGLTDQDETVLEIHVLSLQPMDFTGTHAREETQHEVVAIPNSGYW